VVEMLDHLDYVDHEERPVNLELKVDLVLGDQWDLKEPVDQQDLLVYPELVASKDQPD
jgi:hypothetical protein